MPKIIDIKFSNAALVSGIQVQQYGDDELRNHGAPCSLTVVRGNMPESPFWDCARAVGEVLSGTPDSVNLRAAEINKKKGFISFDLPNGGLWTYPGPGSGRSRNYSGGDDYASFDSIDRENTGIVADKALREMRAMGLISVEDYTQARRMLAEAGLNVAHYNGPMGKVDLDSNPADYFPTSRGLSRATTEFLKASVPSETKPSRHIEQSVEFYPLPLKP